MRFYNSHLKLNTQVFREQVAHLYNHAPLSLGFSILNGFILVYLQRTVISNQTIVLWFSSLLVVTLARAVLVFVYRHVSTKQSDQVWHVAYVVGAMFAGLVWAGSAVFLFPDYALEHQLFVVFVLAGMTAASVPVLAASMIAFLIFAFPVLITLAVQLYLGNTVFSTSMAIMVVFYILGLSISAIGMNRTIVTSLMLRFDNRELASEIIERQSTEDELFQQKERLQITFSSMAEGVITTTVDGLINYVNPAAENMFGWLFSELDGKKVEHVFTYFNENTGQCTQGAISECLKKIRQSKKTNLLLIKDDRKIVVEEVVTPLKDRAGNFIGTVAIVRDITQASEHSRQLAYQASHDNLTGLPNRALLSDRLEHAINKAIRANNMVAVLYLDLDRFKHVNDSLGHSAGDRLLHIVAERLCGTIRQEDTVARIGGDEFVVILEGLVTQNQANVVAEKIVENLATPTIIETQKIIVNVSIGISIFPRDGRNVELLLKNADTAMYQTKQQTGTSIKFYIQEMSEQVDNRLKVEQLVQQAITEQQLELFYQPRVNTTSGKIEGNEALIRWKKSTDIQVSTSEFIHIAEDTGAISEIGGWVLQTACQQAQSWIEDENQQLQIAVNLSVSQIHNHGFVNLIAGILNDTGLTPDRLELEISENVFLTDPEHVVKILRKIKSLGVKLAIDDFGSGYSCLAYIKQIPVDIVKIGKSFIDEINSESSGNEIVDAIIALAHGLDLEIIAEGVENEVQRNYLRSLKCTSYQGYYFSKPLPVHSISNLLTHNLVSTKAL